jgi:hypothetical protein
MAGPRPEGSRQQPVPRAPRRPLNPRTLVAWQRLELPASPDERLALCPDGSLWVDVDAFEEAAITARHAREAAVYRTAPDLYPGELLPQDRYEPWAEQRRAELRELFLSLLVELATLHEELGGHGPAIEALSRVVAEESTHEEALRFTRVPVVASGRTSLAGCSGRDVIPGTTAWERPGSGSDPGPAPDSIPA